MEYIFTLRYQWTGPGGETEHLIERLGAGGCDDALIGLGHPGRIAMEFSREAVDAESALQSALEDVSAASNDLHLIEVAPDLVGLTDAAEWVGISRQGMRKLMLSHWQTFPRPVHEGSVSIWHLADILSWFEARGGYSIDSRTSEIAELARRINLENRIMRSSQPLDRLAL